MQPTMTFRQAFDKVTGAYFKGEIKVFDPHFCFCGSLCGNSREWCDKPYDRSHRDFVGFRGYHFVRMEQALFKGMGMKTNFPNNLNRFEYIAKEERRIENLKEYETALFSGMSAAIDEMRKIYEEEGWELGDDEVPALPSRKVLNVYDKNK